MRPSLLGLAMVLALSAAAGPAAAPEGAWPRQNRAWAEAMKSEKTWLWLPIAAESAPRDASGRWKPESLAALLAQDPSWQSAKADVAPRGRRLSRHQDPRVLLIENSSSVSPWSKRLAEWGWNARLASFEAVENEPRRYFDAENVDLLVFSSPGWWQDFANPPSGPSRMGEAVAATLSDFIRMGGTAIFLDVAQWDMEAAGFTGLRMAQLGPREVVEVENPWGQRAKVGLAAFGTMAQRLPQGAAPIFWKDDFENQDGDKGRAYPAFVCVPEQGLGFVVGLAFHPLEQDEEVAAQAQALVTQAWLLSGSKSVFWDGSVPTRSAKASPSPLPSPKANLTPSRQATAQATASPSALPTLAPPSATGTPWPSATATPRVPRILPSPSPILLQATPIPTLLLRPKPSATFSPSPQPTFRPTAQATFERAVLKAKLSCLQSSPEPFSEGGVYLFFCIDQAAQIRYRIFDQKGRELYSSELTGFNPGRNQVFYAGLNQKGQYLAKGRYFYRLEAVYTGQVAEWRQAEFNFKPKHR